MNIAVEGCCHGELDKIYERIKSYEIENNIKVDLLLCCGDFQAIRHEQDLNDLSCPPKYRAYRDFRDYYNCTKESPILTIFVGGNHEAPDLLRNLYYGGWVAPNIYYLGHSGVVNIEGYFETSPYNEETKRSAYHIREFDVKKLSMLKTPIDIFLSHDWPAGIENYGNLQELLRIKPYFYEDIKKNTLGNPRTKELLDQLRPRFWFSAHLHVKYEAEYRYNDGSSTYFLALDKVLPYREFLRVLQIFPKNYNKKNKNVTYKRNRTECDITEYKNSDNKEIDEEKQEENKQNNNNNINKEDNKEQIENNEVEVNKNNSNNSNDNKTNYIKLCYDREWCAILVANKDKMPLNTFPSVNPITLNEPTDKDFDFVDQVFNKSGYEELYVENNKYYIIPYNKDIHKDLKFQRESFMKLLELEDNNYFNPDLNKKFKVNFVD